ncbi:MAG TPA: serine hydrolase [Candidatus Limnocylindria bacterium]|jgi:beta-lactamase class A|nr:serine hydrolase [Candidatus Limnocylindria bacterium]
MRGVGFGLAVCLVLGVIAPARAQASTADLIRQLESLVASFPGGAGVWVGDPNVPTPLFTHDPEEQVIAASLYKLGVLAEAERRVDSGDFHYSDPVMIEPEDITSDGSFEEAGTRLTLDEALEAMITISDNGSALALWHILGGANIDATLQKSGIADFHIAFDQTEDHWATPRAVGMFFTLLAKRQLISAAASDRMLARLQRQQINNRLPAQLPSGVVVAHKTGNLAGVTHDAGIIYTKSGPRVVVAMTWDALDEDADNFISSVGASVYSAILEPSANARYQVAKGAIAVDVGTQSRVIVPITNIGTRGWTASGPGSVGLIWELRNNQSQLVTSSPRPQTLPALQPQQTQNISIDVSIPKQPGTYTVTIGLTDASGNALASAGAATATFTMRAHQPYLVTAQIGMPHQLHRNEASLLVVSYAAVGGSTDRPLSISWRVIDPRTNRTIQQGSSAVGTLKAGANGTFFASFLAPNVLGTYRLVYELTDGSVAVSEPVSTTVEIAGPRTYPDDEGGRAVPTSQSRATPTPSPRFEFPTITIPKPSLPITLPLRGKSPSPSPAR